ncbi:MAG: hypothetical protein Q8Q41_03505 [bacterium]|nr:hypothetical protein [bacterium]
MSTSGVVAFAFGSPKTIRSNLLIGEIASECARALVAPVFSELNVPFVSGIDVTLTEEVPGSPPPTLRLAREAVRWAVVRGINILHVAAAEPHLWRCLRDLVGAVLEAKMDIRIAACERISRHPRTVWFCPESEQIYTASAHEWEKRERILRLMPLVLYKVIAS